MRRSVGTSLVILTALILQTTVLPHVALFRVAPDLLLVVVISVALARGPSAGALAGFGGGVLRDLLLDAPTGLSALAYLSVGYVVGAVLPYVQSSSVAVPLVGVFAGSLAGTAFYNVLALLLGVVISVALARWPSAGALAGFGGGVLRDLLLDAPTGLSALAYLSVGYVVG